VSSQRGIDFQIAVAFNPSGIVITDHSNPEAPIVFVNPAFTVITGYSAAEAYGRNCRFLQGPETDPAAKAAIRDALSTGSPVKLELVNYRKTGEPFWNELSIQPTLDGAGKVTGYVGFLNDVTVRRKTESERLELVTRLTSITQNIPGYVFQRTLKADGTVSLTYLSPSFATVMGMEPGREAKLGDLWELMHADDIEPTRDSIARSAAELSPLNLEFRLTTEAGGERWIRNRSMPRCTVSGDIIWDGVGLDVTAEKLAEKRLSFLAYHDPLTGLPNRLLLTTSLGVALNAAASDQNEIALFKIDLDDFQEINDAIGQSAADGVLRTIAKRLSKAADDHGGYAARIGGDEFAVLQSVRGDELFSRAAEICKQVAVPISVDDREIVVDACIGAAVACSTEMESPQPGEAASELMKRAHVALNEAKRAGRGVCRVYSTESDDRLRNRMLLRQSLRRGIGEGQFRLHYHPLVDLASGRIVGAEALIRWDHPELGLQRPDVFIPLAESSGLIIPLGEWVLNEAMRQSQEWTAQGIKVPRIAINVSGVQIHDPAFLHTVQRALAQTGANASNFELELTEGFMIDASTEILKVLNAVKATGFSLAVDDFGTGHSSFSYLRDFPVDKVKIDQTFVRQMVIDSSDASIIRAIVALAKSLRLGVVAEGIETAAQRDFLRDEGCCTGQGYLFSLPLTAEDFAFLLASGVTLPVAPPVEAPRLSKTMAMAS
jgi:diguanylate cyclase (GGDEF)-like protein/PAS domain S-box-containing protein